LGSTHFKDSGDIKFAKFGQVDYLLLNLQVQDRNRDLKFKLKPVLTQFDWGLTGLAMWHDVSG
jgi:hypothetical protein